VQRGAVARSVDPFDLPDWLGTETVVWTALSSIHDRHHISGALSAGERSLACDLLAADAAYPVPVLPDTVRTSVHQAWTHGQALLIEYDGRLTIAVPGTAFTADLVLECVGRLAKAVGVSPSQFAATLRL